MQCLSGLDPESPSLIKEGDSLPAGRQAARRPERHSILSDSFIEVLRALRDFVVPSCYAFRHKSENYRTVWGISLSFYEGDSGSSPERHSIF